MKSLFILIFNFSVTLASAQDIDIHNSSVSFAVRNMKMRTVEGTFTGMQGEVNFDENNISNTTIDVCIDANTVNTDNEKRDAHLRKEDFFGVEQYPKICFVSNFVEKQEDAYLIVGKLTLHGVTKTITVPLSFENSTLTGSFSIERNDYDLGPNGGFMVGKDVEITISCKLL
ncbi:MAG: YceI family protein [Jejuia sp.]